MNLRVLISTLAVALCGLAMAQPYTVVVQGHITDCSPAIASGWVMIETVQNTQPYDSVMVQLNENCFYHYAFTVNDPTGWFQVTGNCMNGAVDINSGQYNANFLGADTLTLDLDCGGVLFDDCQGVPGGSALPGTPCDDNDMNTINDHWTANCECIGTPGDCIAHFSLESNSPYTLDFNNLSIGADLIYSWQLPMGETSSDFEPATYTFPQSNAYQIYGVCLTVTGNGCTTWHCDTIVVDPNGGLEFGPVTFDCEGTVNGSALPGTPCDDGNPATSNDHWTADCNCEGSTSAPYTVVVSGHIAGCTPAIAGGTVTIQSIQGTGPAVSVEVQLNENCYYQHTFIMDDPTGWFQVTGNCMNGTADNNTGQYAVNNLNGTASITIDLDCGGTLQVDCVGVSGGSALPGTPCDDNDPNTFNDHWTMNCVCVGTAGTGVCEAGYWVIQGMDSANGQIEPIPFELWVWNQSEGTGDMQYVWDFGDGTSSSDPYPTHVYGGPGPYILCLSMVDATGCTDTFCDTLSVDGDGIFGMVLDGNVRNSLTLNVIQTLPSFTTGIEDATPISAVSAWPNPASDLLNIALNSTITSSTHVSIIDLNGRVVRTLNSTFTRGKNQLIVPIADLANGMYSIRIENGGTSIAQRFVKQ